MGTHIFLLLSAAAVTILLLGFKEKIFNSKNRTENIWLTLGKLRKTIRKVETHKQMQSKFDSKKSKSQSAPEILEQNNYCVSLKM